MSFRTALLAAHTHRPSIVRLAMFATLVALFLILASPARAVPISYTFTGEWRGFEEPFGPTYTATVLFDNGGSTVANQTYMQADFISATLVSGTYNETATSADITDWRVDFVSEPFGRLHWGWFEAQLPDGDFWRFDNVLHLQIFELPSGASAALFQSGQSNNPGTVIPEPSTYVLLALGMMGLAYSTSRVGSRSS